MSEFLQTNHAEDVEASLTLALDAILRAKADDAYWKSATIFIFLALQGICVCCITNTDGSGPFIKSVEKQIRNYWDVSSQKALNEAHETPFIIQEPEWPKEYLADIKELLKRLPSSVQVSLSNSTDSSTTSL